MTRGLECIPHTCLTAIATVSLLRVVYSVDIRSASSAANSCHDSHPVAFRPSHPPCRRLLPRAAASIHYRHRSTRSRSLIRAWHLRLHMVTIIALTRCAMMNSSAAAHSIQPRADDNSRRARVHRSPMLHRAFTRVMAQVNSCWPDTIVIRRAFVVHSSSRFTSTRTIHRRRMCPDSCNRGTTGATHPRDRRTQLAALVRPRELVRLSRPAIVTQASMTPHRRTRVVSRALVWVCAHQ
jgi:hypothetical protein